MKYPVCEDLDAINYNSTESANWRENACIYESSGSLYWEDYSVGYFTSKGATNLRFEIDGKIVGNSSPFNSIGSSNPSCQEGSIKFEFTNYYREVIRRVLVYDQNNVVVFDVKIPFEPHCKSYNIFDYY